jgi:hypothetical protein
MNLDAFEKSLRLIAGYYIDNDDDVVDELLDANDLVRDYDHPFSKELNINLLQMETKEGKRSIIKYYIFAFKDPFGLFLHNKELLFTESDMSTEEYNKHIVEGRFDLLPKYVPRDLNRFQQYVLKANDLFTLLFDEIQDCCNKYQIDIWEVCEEIDFPIDFCDTGISSCFTEDLYAKKQTKDLENINSINGNSGKDKISPPLDTRSNENLKSFPEYLLYNEKLKLAEALKVAYKGKKGKYIKLMFEGLKRNNKIIIQNHC